MPQTNSSAPPLRRKGNKRNVSSQKTWDAEPDNLESSGSDVEAPLPRRPASKSTQANRQRVLDDNVESESEDEQGGVGNEVVARGQVNLDRDTIRLPLSARNQVPQEAETDESDLILQEKYKKVCDALRLSQSKVVQLKENGKRKHVEASQQGPDQEQKQKKQKTSESKEEREKHARDLGKRFVFQHILWIDTRLIFNSDEHNDKENNVIDGPENEVTQAFPDEPVAGWSLDTAFAIDLYTRSHLRCFKSTLSARDLRNWGRDWFKKEFCNGARKFRSDMLKGLANRPVEVFRLQETTLQQFLDKKLRSELPEIKRLLANDTFLLGDIDGTTVERFYRSECIVSIILRIYWGPEAVLLKGRAQMAHKTYGSKFKSNSVTLHQLAAAALIAKIILEGDAEFSDSNAERVEYYWKRLHFLHLIKNRQKDVLDGTIKWINKQIGLGGDGDEELEAVNQLEQDILGELGG